MTHVRTAPCYPQLNGKLEGFHKTIKVDATRPKPPATADEARRVVSSFVRHYNTERPHFAIDHVTPADRLAGRHTAIITERDRKLEAARELRAAARQAAREPNCSATSSPTSRPHHP